MRFSSTTAAYTAPKVPRTHCVDAGGPPGARRDKSPPSETAPGIPDAAKSAIPPKTSAATELFPGPAGVAPSTCPNLPTRPSPRPAARLAGCSRRRSRHAPSVPIRRASASIRAPALKPVPKRSPIPGAAKAAAQHHARPCPYSSRPWMNPVPTPNTPTPRPQPSRRAMNPRKVCPPNLLIPTKNEMRDQTHRYSENVPMGNEEKIGGSDSEDQADRRTAGGCKADDRDSVAAGRNETDAERVLHS